MDDLKWEACASPTVLLDFLQVERNARRTKVGRRKLHLFVAECCRRVAHLLPEPEWQALIEVVEGYADGQRTKKDLLEARQHCPQHEFTSVLEDESESGIRNLFSYYSPEDFARQAVALATWPSPGDALCCRNRSALARGGYEMAEEIARQAAVLRDLFGNPFRRVAFDARWRTRNVRDLARTIYEEPAFERLPILADALLDAACDSAAVLDHCRSEGPHVRGCWVVDLILSKG